MITLPFARFRFHCRAITPLSLPPYAGSTWRGAFGHALKRIVCVTRTPRCPDCLLWRSCVYSDIFETPPPPDTPLLANCSAAPHPFILHPEATNGAAWKADEAFTMELTLIGRAASQLPYIVHAWGEMGKQGVGGQRGRYRLEGVSQLGGGRWWPVYQAGGELRPLPPETSEPPPPPSGICSLVFETPVRIRHRGRLMGPAAFHFRGLAASLLRRLSLLHHFHGGGPLETDFRALLQQAEAVEPLEQDLDWYDWQRYSARQQTHMKMGGLVGRLTFEADSLRPFWPWLALGQQLHVGKSVSMGLGRYCISAETD